MGFSGGAYPLWYIAVEREAGASYTVVDSDAGKLKLFTSDSAVSVSIPSSVADTEDHVVLVQLGDGVLTLSGAGVTFPDDGFGADAVDTAGKGAVVSLFKVGASSWFAVGDLV